MIYPIFTCNLHFSAMLGENHGMTTHLREELGYDEYSYWIDSSMDFETKKKSLQLFIDKVMPAFN